MHSTKNANPIFQSFFAIPKALFLASRPKTWSASICPVLIGTALVAKEKRFNQETISIQIFITTLLFAMLLQIGTNYVNDCCDFINGADTKERIGPKRAVQQGWISPRFILIAASIVFIIAIGSSLSLMISAGWWSWIIALVSICCGILYSAGPKPLSYLGLGESFAFLFFGPVAVIGTYLLQHNILNDSVIISSFAPGFLSAAILLANNLRDENTDRRTGKRTLVVRLGTRFARRLYTFFIIGTTAVPLLLICRGSPWILSLASITCLFAPIKKMFSSIAVLQETSLLLLVYTLLFCGALLW